MIRRGGLVMIALVCAAPHLFAGWGSPCEINFTPLTGRIIVIAKCTFTFADGTTQNRSVWVRGELKVSPGGSGGIDKVCAGWGYCGMSHEISSPSASTTYTATANFFAEELMIPISQKKLTETHTTPPPIRPRTDPLPGDSQEIPCERENGCSPIVISLSGGYSLSGANDPVLFDIDADGVKDRIGWTARGSDELFLALDRDGDGVIADGTELFGNATPLRDGSPAANGFEALKELDDNGDNRIDSRDQAWAALLLWNDGDHDGVSAASELSTLAASPIEAIDLDYRWSGRRDRHGNEFRYQARLESDYVHRQIYDVFFVAVR